ncbi:hypothetical protein [Sabulicella glaciei]|uniref:Uncharacterized protein n=1 Tax=Sabulicella glaciei TaxID=2984948 RepID=A0ABT3P244_9PROT|nr:hypothetical protein [Roseococcus sp. MDT2-1-1]MCW8088475.1 hypothetical protein [Roseococcus sp. MDT2-1-1]
MQQESKNKAVRRPLPLPAQRKVPSLLPSAGIRSITRKSPGRSVDERLIHDLALLSDWNNVERKILRASARRATEFIAAPAHHRVALLRDQAHLLDDEHRRVVEEFHEKEIEALVRAVQMPFLAGESQKIASDIRAALESVFSRVGDERVLPLLREYAANELARVEAHAKHNRDERLKMIDRLGGEQDFVLVTTPRMISPVTYTTQLSRLTCEAVREQRRKELAEGASGDRSVTAFFHSKMMATLSQEDAERSWAAAEPTKEIPFMPKFGRLEVRDARDWLGELEEMGPSERAKSVLNKMPHLGPDLAEAAIRRITFPISPFARTYVGSVAGAVLEAGKHVLPGKPRRAMKSRAQEPKWGRAGTKAQLQAFMNFFTLRESFEQRNREGAALEILRGARRESAPAYLAAFLKHAPEFRFEAAAVIREDVEMWVAAFSRECDPYCSRVAERAIVEVCWDLLGQMEPHGEILLPDVKRSEMATSAATDWSRDPAAGPTLVSYQRALHLGVHLDPAWGPVLINLMQAAQAGRKGWVERIQRARDYKSRVAAQIKSEGKL